MEHSVPAGDKGEACQRPHSSELTHTTMHITHAYTCAHSHRLFTLYSAFYLFFFYTPIPFLLLLALCSMPFVISLFSLHSPHPLYASSFARLHVSSVTPPLDVYECTVGMGKTILDADRSQNPLCSPADCRHSGKCTDAIHKLSSLCKNDVISSCRASCYESRMS